MNWQESDLPGSEKAEAVVALADKSGGFGSEISMSFSTLFEGETMRKLPGLLCDLLIMTAALALTYYTYLCSQE